jgi:4-hydroxy-tetrahydrodipicolinate reductase
MAKTKILINGAAGKMGREVIKAVAKEPDLELVGAVDVIETGVDAGILVGIKPTGIEISKDLDRTIRSAKPDVVVDFTHPNVVMDNVRMILKNKVHAVVGTTGLGDGDMKEIKALCNENGVNCLVAPNFAVGAVLMMKFAKEAIKVMPSAEIIELHHDQKADAPSGTSIKTAEMMLEERSKKGQGSSLPAGQAGVKGKEIEKIDGVRGGTLDGLHIHSVRLPGFVAHQEVIFGGVGQTLTIRHDSISRESFMPGVLIAVKKIKNLKGLTYGIESIL